MAVLIYEATYYFFDAITLLFRREKAFECGNCKLPSFFCVNSNSLKSK